MAVRPSGYAGSGGRPADAVAMTEEVTGPRAPRLCLAVVFLLSRRCNLACGYCNVDAAPRVRGRLDPRLFESWVRTIGELGDLELGIQLHGGEPLVVDPSVELYSSIARNALARTPTSRMGSLGIVTNGLLLDRPRAQSLLDAGFHVVVSVDGSQRIHDRFRLNASGRGSHRHAMRAVGVLRSLDVDPAVIAVVTQPADVLEALQFFIEQEFSSVKINPVRPEGRGAAFPPDDHGAHMLAMAAQHFLAAKAIAAHNRRHADHPIYEENILSLMSRIMRLNAPFGAGASWTLLVDDTGTLWSHPGGRGVAHMKLTSGGVPSVAVLSRALGLRSGSCGASRVTGDRAAETLARQRATFRPCRGCTDPMWCTRFRPLVVGGAGEAPNPDCLWRERLTQLLSAWWREDPDEASLVVCPRRMPMTVSTVRGSASTQPDRKRAATRGGRDGLTGASWGDDPLDPTARAILKDIRVADDGEAFLDNHADWVLRLKTLNAFEHDRLFVQLAVLAGNYADQRRRLALARTLAHLARIGLTPLARAPN